MTVINEFTAYCAICGGPIEDPDVDRGWLSQALLLHSNNEFPNTQIRELPAKNVGGPYFELLENAEAVTAYDKSSSVPESPRLLYVPCHGKCVSLVKRVMASQEAATHRDSNDSMQYLWHVLKALFENASKDSFYPICNTNSAYAYNDIWRFQGLVWHRGTDGDWLFDSMHFEADPEDIPDMTESIISHLQPLPVAPINGSHLTELSQLPQPGNLSLDCTAQSSSSAWREGLLRGFLPWLWDLEPEIFARKEASRPLDQGWNWELLVRQLSQENIHEPRAVLEDLPMGLRNRKRIWRLVEDLLSGKLLNEALNG